MTESKTQLETSAERRLKELARERTIAQVKLDAAKLNLDQYIRETASLIRRRRAAEITGLTPGRIQQIIDLEGSDD